MSELRSSAPLAVIVPTRDRPHLLGPLLEAFKSALRPGDQLIVVDSASQDPEVARIADAGGAHVVRSDLPGASRARNLGASVATAPILAFTDDDCRPGPGWAAAIERSLGDPRVGFVTGAVLPDRAAALAVSVQEDGERRVFDAVQDPASIGHGANMAFRRDVYLGVGGMDEALGIGGRFGGSGEQDLFWRVLRSGWRGVYDPEVRVVHHQWRTNRQALFTQFRYGIGAGAFAVKAARVDGSVGYSYLRARFWDQGVASAARNLRQRRRAGFAADAARAGGVFVGATRARFARLDGDRYAG